MTLLDAWTKIKKMEQVDLLVPKQVYAIVCDYGVFIAKPKLQIIAKIALQNGLWDIVKATTIKISEIEMLRKKLDFYGFSDSYILMLFDECGFKLSSYQDSTTNKYYKDSIHSQHSELSTLQSSYNTPLTSPSSSSDIEKYLNSVFEIDKNSFQKNGLVLQRIQPIEWKKGAGYYRDEYGACISFEVTGTTKFQGDIEVEIYDLNGFLRKIEWLSGIYIDGKYSIINETKIVDFNLTPQNISKMVLHIGIDGVHMGSAFYGDTESIFRYEGIIENETESFEILHTQFLYANEKKDADISVFFRYRIKQRKKKFERVGEKNLYIVLFDNDGMLRQRIPLFDNMEYYRISNIGGGDREHCAFSYHNIGSRNPSLKMPFDEIGKIVFIEE